MLFKCFVLVLLTCHCFGDDTSLTDLIAEIFKTGESTPNPPIQPRPTQSTGPINPTNPLNPLNPNEPAKEGGQYQSCGTQKECVPRWLCQNDTINTSGENIIDIRIDTDQPCSNYLEQCCDLSNKRETPVVPIPKFDADRGCGFRNPNGAGFRITGAKDQEAEFAEFPWMVAILREDNQINLYECGGALIAPDVILTAAHCVHNKDARSLIVRAGEWDTQNKIEIIPHEDRYVKDLVYHENYNKGSLYNDVALLFLESPFSFQENIQPICLPDVGEIFDFSRCYATGWGKSKFGKEGEYQVILKKIDLPVVPNEKCQTNLRATRLGRYFQLHDSFMCAGGEKGKDTCKGDGGSPLACPIKNQPDRYKSAGLVAWGIGCGEENIPGVYANVASLRPWIDEKLAQRQVNPKYYTA